jgi:hypothetical protein
MRKISGVFLIFLILQVFNFLSGEVALCSKIKGEKQERQEEVIKFLASFLPAEIEGWHATREDTLYNPETIFSYIDGAGEVYRAFNFRWLLVRRYEKENQPAITVDFFDMGRSEEAFGVFTHDLEGERVPLGQDGLYKGGWLAFWKDKFYVSIYSEKETEEIKRVLLALGKEISQAIPGEGPRPLILDYLPDGWDKNQAHYFHSLPILNYHFFVSSENWLELDQTTEAVLAWKWKKPGKKIHLLIIRYPEEARAQRAIKKFLENYLPEADESGLARTENGFWDGARAQGNLGMVVFGAESAEEIEALINQVLEKLNKKK